MKFLTVMLVSVMTCVTPVVLTTLTAFAKNSNPQTDKIYQSAKFQLQKREQQLKNESVSEWYIPGQSPLLVQIFSANGQLLSEKMDSNMDGFFEKRIFYDHKQRTRTEKNYEPTEKHLLTETVQKLSSNKRMLLNTTQYNSKSAVIGKTQYQLPLADVLNQTNAECKTGAQSTVFGQIEALKPLINELLITERNDQFVVTSFGAKIETSCLKQHGDDFPQLVQQSLRENINCLADLGGNGSHENIAKIASLLENKKRPWKIICSDKEAFEGISNTKGLGSVEGIHADFPWIKLNPDLEGSNPKALRGLIFHEILHNCGHIHAPGNIEYM